jgi:cytochrome c556
MIRLVTLCALGVLVCAALPTRADDQDVIDYRTHVMKTLGEQTDAIGMILENKAPPDNFATHLKVLAVTATQAKKAFEPKVPGGNAKPEVWANWADFSKRLDELVATTAELATAAQHESVAAVAAKIKSTLKCKGCHDNYRKPLK